jgi:hypothetical protein
MVYTALPDRRIPYDNDGTQVGFWSSIYGVHAWLSGAQAIEANDDDFIPYSYGGQYEGGSRGTIWFFPEQREVTAMYALCYTAIYNIWDGGVTADRYQPTAVQGSNNSGNGLDGTWETATMSGGMPLYANAYSWRGGIVPVSFTGTKATVRVISSSGFVVCGGYIGHLYGEKGAGQTPDDIIYINHDDTPGVEYTAPEDFGDQPLGTTVVRQFRVKNTSATKTANTINIQCNDSDFAISEDNSNWVVTINISSLAAGAESATLYVRCTTPAIGGLLGPRYARIVTTVASYT